MAFLNIKLGVMMDSADDLDIRVVFNDLAQFALVPVASQIIQNNACLLYTSDAADELT